MEPDPQPARPLTPEEEAKAHRATIILYVVMVVMVAAPLVVFFLAR